MTDSAPFSDSRDDLAAEPDRPSASGAPRWVKVTGIVVVVLVVLLLVLKLAGVEHGPGRHTGSGGSGAQTLAFQVTQDGAPSGANPGGHTPPAGVEGHTPSAGVLERAAPQP